MNEMHDALTEAYDAIEWLSDDIVYGDMTEAEADVKQDVIDTISSGILAIESGTREGLFCTWDWSEIESNERKWRLDQLEECECAIKRCAERTFEDVWEVGGNFKDDTVSLKKENVFFKLNADIRKMAEGGRSAESEVL